MRFDVISVTPESLESYFRTSVLGRAQSSGKISIAVHSLRDWAEGSYKQVDDKPYGGGAGMVLMAAPILEAVAAVKSKISARSGSAFGGKNQKSKVVVLSAKGKQFNQKTAHDWAKKYRQLILISGRYEGIDERVKMILKAEEISIGPYVLTDGDVAAMVIVSAIARLIPGVIKLESLAEESHWNLLTKSETIGKGLEYPHYTRPEVITYKNKKYRVPSILLSGNHQKIAAWRRQKSR